MGVRILENRNADMAVLYDSVTETTFGPVFRDWESADGGPWPMAGEVAEAFLVWLEEDPRRMLPVDVVTEYGNFVAEIERDGWDAVVGEEVTT